jgi:hypothetical protein
MKRLILVAWTILRGAAAAGAVAMKRLILATGTILRDAAAAGARWSSTLFYGSVPWLLLIAVFPVAGWLTGWLVGQSRTPVVGALLPLLFGLAGALTYGLLDRSVKGQAVLKALKEELDPVAFEKVQPVVAEQLKESLWLPAFWALGVILFCGACYGGLRIGLSFRVPEYPPLEELMKGAQPTDKEWALLYTMRWHLQANNTPVEDVKRLFEHAIRPALSKQDKNDRDNYVRFNELDKMVDRFLKLKPIERTAWDPKESTGS